MPEVTIAEYDDTCCPKDDVGLSRKFRRMKTVPKTVTPQLLSELSFCLGVP
jgi:hypothetical protein